MSKLLLRWVLLAVSVYAASLVAQAIHIGFQVDISTAGSVIQLLLGVGILSLLNATLGKILKLLTLPLSCITLGLFSLVVNAVVLMLAASLKLGFRIEEHSEGKAFLAAFIASILISFINGVLGVFLPDDD